MILGGVLLLTSFNSADVGELAVFNLARIALWKRRQISLPLKFDCYFGGMPLPSVWAAA